jgi:hypothetical protein
MPLKGGAASPHPAIVRARVDIRDQFHRWNDGRGRIEFAAVPIGFPAPAVDPPEPPASAL